MPPTDNANRPGHAPLPRATKCTRLQRRNRLIEVGVRHDDQMVLRPAGGLHALAVLGAGFVDVFRDRSRTDERDGPHFRMRQQHVHCFLIPVHDIEHARPGSPASGQQLRPTRFERQRHLSR